MLKPICITGVIAAAMVLTGCPSDNPSPSDVFDRRAMLADVADKLIIPGYATLNNSNNGLLSVVEQFTAQPSVALLSACQDAWKTCVFKWQNASPYNFGPAEGAYGTLRENIATFPCDTALTELYIALADTSFQNFDRDTRGFYAVDYLLFAGDAQSTVLKFQDNSRRRAYLRSVVRDIQQQVFSVFTAWTSTYRNEFVSRNGTDAGSSTSLVFNHMNMSYELAKNYKLSLPLGKQAGQTQVEPEKVEGYYSGYSIALLREHFASIMRLWRGESVDGANTIGFEEYLESVPGGDRLTFDTELQSDSVMMAFSLLADEERLSSIINGQPDRLEPLFTAMQKFTRFIKSELSSLIGIAITYSSGDGD